MLKQEYPKKHKDIKYSKKSNKRQNYFNAVALICLVVFTSCKVTSQEPQNKDIVITKNLKWSEKMPFQIYLIENHQHFDLYKNVFD